MGEVYLHCVSCAAKKVCHSHAMKGTPECQDVQEKLRLQATAPVRKLRTALAGLVGESDTAVLTKMLTIVQALPAPDADKLASTNAIQALLETENYK